MKIFFTKKFIQDLKKIKDIKIYQSLFTKVFQDDGNFTKHREDHRFKTIENAWIRRLTGGKTAYRMIYIINNDRVYLFRIGNHDIEDNLTFDSNLNDSIAIEDHSISYNKNNNYENFNEYSYFDNSYLLYTKSDKKFVNELISIYQGSYKKIVLVAPFINLHILEDRHDFGKFLQKQFQLEQTKIEIFTSYKDNLNEDRLKQFENISYNLRADIYFINKLHSKLYFFELDFEKTGNARKILEDTAIIGSANLTDSGLDFERKVHPANDEIGFKLPSIYHNEIGNYISRLKVKSHDTNSLRKNINEASYRKERKNLT